MPIDDLSGSLTTTTREQEIRRFLRDYKFRRPEDDTSPGTQPYVLACAAADFVMPLYRDIQLVADAMDPDKISGTQLAMLAEPRIGPKLPAAGASGLIRVTTSAGGATIYAGDEFQINGNVYTCQTTALYQNGGLVPIVGVTTGTGTNQAPGVAGKWSNPRPGCTSTAVVDTDGLTGGRADETDDEYRQRWLLAEQNPPAAGNAADIERIADAALTGQAQKSFVYPAILGPGTCGVTITLKSANGQKRTPNNAQLSAVLAAIEAALPPDGYFVVPLISSPVTLVVKVTWSPDASTWADARPWPPYQTDHTRDVIVEGVTSTTSFRVGCRSYTGALVAAPAAGNKIALFNASTGSFSLKTIATVSTVSSGHWSVTCVTDNNASDSTYLPVLGQRVSPWSDSLNDTVARRIPAYFATLGPGEQIDTTGFDEGLRRRREPRPPAVYPSVLTTADIVSTIRGPYITDVDPVEPTLPYATPIGTPGMFAYLLELGDLAAFPQ